MSDPIMNEVAGVPVRQRQHKVTLESALQSAILYMRSQELAYRNPNGREAWRMDKKVRNARAAELADEIRLLEAALSKAQPRTQDDGR